MNELVKVRPGTRFLRELRPGEHWMPHPSGDGVIITHPDRKPVWLHIQGDGYVEEPVGVS